MKKKLSILLLLCICVGIVSGCGEKKEEKKKEETKPEATKTIECTLTQNTSGTKLNATYKIYATGEIVDKVETVEVVESSDSEVLNTIESQVRTQYENSNKRYGGTDFKITNDGKKMESKVTIDYSKYDMEKMVNENSVMKSLVDENNRLTVTGAKSIYTGMGAICK